MNKKSALVNLAVLVLPLAIAFPVAYGVFIFLYRPGQFLTATAISILLGLLLLFMSKMPGYRRGVFLSFGYGLMGKRERLFYLIGYFFIVVGVIGMAFLLLRPA